MDVSILFLTWNRNEQAKRVLEHNWANMGLDRGVELLVCDQGSDEPFKTDAPVSHFRQNKNNEGVARALNQLMLRREGRHVFFMPNDVLMPDDWLADLLYYAEFVPNSGILTTTGSSIEHEAHEVECRDHLKRTIYFKKDITGLEGCQVFGPVLITRQCIETIGYYCEDYHPYGFEDSDYCFRACLAGLLCYYIPSKPYIDLCPKENEPKDYHDAKESWYWANLGHHRWRALNYHKIGLYVPPPIMRPPME